MIRITITMDLDDDREVRVEELRTLRRSVRDDAADILSDVRPPSEVFIRQERWV